jgi:hypothetical protein
MKIKLPVTWEMCGEIEVEAKDIGDAIQDFRPDKYDLPQEKLYVDGSFRLTTTDPQEVFLFQPVTPQKTVDGNDKKS